jgi:ribonuclease P protein component
MKHTIKSKADFEELFSTGRRISTRNILALIATNNNERDHYGRVAFVAGKRLGSAPLRNRAKRVMREAARATGAPWRGFDVILIARSTTAHASVEANRADMVKVVAQLEAWDKQ